MPLTTDAVPTGDQPAPESTPGPVKADKPAAAAKAPKVLGRASESGDAGVQNLLAQRMVHESNGDSDAVDTINAQLAELGLA